MDTCELKHLKLCESARAGATYSKLSPSNGAGELDGALEFDGAFTKAFDWLAAIDSMRFTVILLKYAITYMR